MPPPPGRGPPEFVLTPGATSEVYGSMDRGSNAGPDDVNPEGLWEENPAILAPATLLAAQPIELLLQRRDQALDGLRGLLHSLSRVKNASNKLPTYVAKAYQARLQHAIGWYRVTTCEVKRNRAQRQALATALPSSLLPSPDAFLTPDPHMLAPPLGSLAQLVERITFARRGKTPALKKTTSGEWRHVHEPYLVDGVNVFLLIGRVDLAFAPLPAAADPLLLLWFSTNASDWVGEGGVSETLLAPAKMHSLLELSRMQRAHETLLTEAEIWGLSALPLPYEPQNNELGVTFELLLYGSTTRYSSLARRFRVALTLLQQRMDAAKKISKMLRGWVVRTTMSAYKAACKVQRIYRKWKAAAHRRALARNGTTAFDAIGGEGESGGGGGGSSGPLSFDALLSGDVGYQSSSKILQRKYGPGGGSAFAQIVQLARLAEKISAEEKQKQAMLRAAAPRFEGAVSERTLAITAKAQTAGTGGDEEPSAEEAEYAKAAVRVQSMARSRSAQKQVLSLAETADDVAMRVANDPRGNAAVASVCKAYRSRNAFSMLLLKAFKQRQMAVVMQGTEGGDLAGRVAGITEAQWRMTLEAVRERCVQSLVPAEEELKLKVKAHDEYVQLAAQFERATARLQFWEALKTGTLPAHLATLSALKESRAIDRSEAYVKALIAQRALPLPQNISPHLHVSKLVGAVKALVEIGTALGTDMHELQPLERQLRSHLVHMGVPDPASHETPAPVSNNAGHAMLPTKASLSRTSAALADQMNQQAAKPVSPVRGGAGEEPPAPPPSGGHKSNRTSGPPSPVPAVAEEGANGAAASPPAMAPGEALEEAIAKAKTELAKLEAVRELLSELRAVDQPTRFVPKLAREAEAKREMLADSIRRLTEVESQHEHLSHFVAQARGTLDLLEAADGFDYRRQRKRLRGEYAQLGIISMQSLRAETDVKKLRDRLVVIEAMQDYLENELPKLEKKARERVEACATMHITLPAEMLDEQLQGALIDDIEEWLGPSWLGHGSRMKVKDLTKASHPQDSCLIAINILEGPGRPVEDLLAALQAEGDRGPDQSRPEANCQKVLTTAPQHVARAGSFGTMKLDLLSVTTIPAHTVVHDASTLADRKRALEALLSDAKAELRPLQAKELVASAAQAQLWKLEGVEECLEQCQNPRLISHKDEERAHRPRLLQLSNDSMSHIDRYSDARRRVLELEARIEALQRLITAAAQPGPGGGEGAPEAAGATPAKKKKKADAYREYSTHAFREVAQNILKERRELLRQQQALGEDMTANQEDKSKSTSQRKYKCQGALQLLKTIHREDKEIWKMTPPSQPPSVRLVAHSRFLRRGDTLQRDAIKMMAREAARLAQNSVPPGQSKGQPSAGHWAQMKAMIQMSPCKPQLDETIFTERDVEAAAAEMDVDLAKDGGLAMIPLVLYFMRAPLPYPFKEELKTSASPPTMLGARSSFGGGSLGDAYAKGSKVPSPPAGAPPPGLRPRPPGTMSAAAMEATSSRVTMQYRNVINKEVELKHPFHYVYSRLAQRSKKLALKRVRPDESSPEAWMEFVEPSGTPYYYCFLTKRREWEFPKLMPVGQLGVGVKTSSSTHAMRLKHRMLQQPKRRLTPASLEAMRLNMEAEQRSKPRRAAMLRKMPLPVSHIVYTAQYLGIDTLTQSHLMWLASAALCDVLSTTLPVGWEQRKVLPDPKAHTSVANYLPVYYYNTALGTSQWEHPSLTHWRSVFAELVNLERQHLSDKQQASHDGTVGSEGMKTEQARPMLWVTADAGLVD